MKKFAYSFMIFTSIVLTFEIGIMIYQIAAKQKEVEQFFSFDDQYQYLFLGDSHIGYSIMPSKELRTKVYWQSGCHPVLSLHKLKEIERSGALKNVKYCFVEFGYQTEASMNYCSLNSIYYSNFSYSWRYFFQMPYRTCLSVDEVFRKGGLGRIGNSDLSETMIPLTERPKNFITDQVADVIPQHFGHLQNPSQDTIEDYRKRLQETFVEFNTICSRNGVKLIVISSPLSSYYREKIPEDAKLNKKDWIKWMRHNHILYLDMTESMPDSSFVESHHLLTSARETFTKKLLARVAEDEKNSHN